MFNEKDKLQFENRGINEAIVQTQIENFIKGFPYLDIKKAATPNDGLKVLTDLQINNYIKDYEKNISKLKILKFVPASGAATRMFKDLFDFTGSGKNAKPEDNKTVARFFTELDKFAFLTDLNQALKNNTGNDLTDARKNEKYFDIVNTLLSEDGLNYGNLPKGLLKFHKYSDYSRTPVEEHLVEGANYASSQGKVFLHFTVSPEHRKGFTELINNIREKYEKELNVVFDIQFSEQKPSTDTVAVDLQNEPFRNSDGSILFRPGGHGALIANLNDLDADIIFIKNIDNLVPDRLKETTYIYKKVIAGVLLDVQNKIFSYLKRLENPNTKDNQLINEIKNFIEKEIGTEFTKDFENFSNAGKYEYLYNKLNRPIRVCGMVKNEGEPGGGPFWALNNDGTISLQIVESSQIDMQNPEKTEIVKNSTHFNPVDLVCATKNYKGEKFDLTKFIDSKTGFISKKSKDGKDLKAQELPGLWNGAMSDWNTIFVEVPIITFNPVKTVIDLLRQEHQ